MEIALYLHIPFCLRKCYYCDFYSTAGAEEPAISEYVRMLGQEMELRRGLLEEDVTATTIYMGGGTPSLLEPKQVATILATAKRYYGLAKTAEITLEANPGTLSEEKLDGYIAAGVNRLSIGVQSFQDMLLERLGRVHTARQARDAFRMARRAGFTNLGMDLMHSIPGETTEMWHDDLHEALGLAPDHISAYPLTIEEGTPLQREVQEKGVLLPDEDDALRMFRDTESILVGAGYEHYEIANFARPGFRSRHNQVYWRHAPYLGFGTGAHSFLPYPQWGARWCNVTPMTRYNELLFSGSLPSEEPQILTRNDAMSEWLFLGLRLLEGVSHDKFRAEFGIGLDSAYPGVIPRLMKAGLLEQDATLHLTRRGVEMANVVFRAFL